MLAGSAAWPRPCDNRRREMGFRRGRRGSRRARSHPASAGGTAPPTPVTAAISSQDRTAGKDNPATRIASWIKADCEAWIRAAQVEIHSCAIAVRAHRKAGRWDRTPPRRQTLERRQEIDCNAQSQYTPRSTSSQSASPFKAVLCRCAVDPEVKKHRAQVCLDPIHDPGRRFLKRSERPVGGGRCRCMPVHPGFNKMVQHEPQPGGSAQVTAPACVLTVFS